MTVRSFKIMLLGAMAVGKTSLARRYSSGHFDEDYKSTIGVQHFSISPIVDGIAHTVNLWDTDGEAGRDIITSPYMAGADGAMIVCDVTRERTIKAALDLADAMDETLPGRAFLMVINKIDERMPDNATLEALGRTGGPVTMTSAKSMVGLDEAMQMLIQTMQDNDDDDW